MMEDPPFFLDLVPASIPSTRFCSRGSILDSGMKSVGNPVGILSPDRRLTP